MASTRTSEGRWGEGVWGRGGEPGSPGASPNQLFLIGTVHGDPQGYDRAGKLLGRLRPQVVTVEISPFSVRYRQWQERRWRAQLTQALSHLPPEAGEHPALRRLAAQVALPFEYRAARDYSRSHGASCHLLDLGEVARRHLPRYGRELLTPANIRALWEAGGEAEPDWVAGEFRRARQARHRPDWRLPGPDRGQTLKRERLMARRLRRLIKQGRRVAHLGGWEHLLPWREEAGLTDLLADLQPVALFLDEADFI